MANVRSRSLKAAQRIKQNNTAMLIIIAIVVALVIALAFQEKRMKDKIAANNHRIQELAILSEQEEQRTQEIHEMESYMQSQEYIESQAKEKLGLIKDGETIFKEEKQ